MAFEDMIEKSIFKGIGEKTFIDKPLEQQKPSLFGLKSQRRNDNYE